MKLKIALLFSIALFSCKELSKDDKTDTNTKEIVTIVNESKYPEALEKVIKAHGGLSAWKDKRVLSYEIAKEAGNEKQTIDLRSRHEKIKMPEVAMGYDGKDFWLSDPNENYKGDPIFYHNLMFYFYAMPFVLADDGIIYSETEPLEFEGVFYPGIRIAYEDGVGVSSKDEYFIHYHPETFQMQWLGYTVTFRSGEKSANVKWICYNDWMTVDQLLLPRSLTWHDYEGRKIKEPKSTRTFVNVVLSGSAKPDGFFGPVEGAKIVTRE
jgi:hypothetical protein